MQTIAKIKTGDLLKTELKPLTRRKTSGDIQTRFSGVEDFIKEIIELDWNEFIERLKITVQDHPQFIKEEVIVFFLRAALSSGKTFEADRLTEILFKRVEKRIERYARKFIPHYYFEDAVGEMLSDLFIKICDLDSDKADFAQVRFWKYLKRLCGDRIRKYQRQKKVDKKSLFIDEVNPETGQAFDIEDEKGIYSPAELQDVRKGLEILPEPIRTAFILRHYQALQIESLDESEWTIANHFGKTERTIRNWLNQAEELLTEWRKEQRG